MPSSWRITSSTITTASQPSGMGSPVSTTVKSPSERTTGVVSVAPKVALAARAMPSMALAG